MFARVTYFHHNDSSFHHHHHQHHHLHQDPTDFSSEMPSVVIAVRPPCRAQTRTLLAPPVVVQMSSDQCNSSVGIHFFTTAVLLDPSSGAVAEGLLEGTTATTGVLVDVTTIIFAFPDLSIAAPGSYTMRLDVYGMYPHSTDGATLIAQLETDTISVGDDPVASHRPSSSEAAIIQLARNAGVPLSPPE
ncbi:hypothetical protein MY1884_002104 [Beauveria asiatica]